MFRSRTQVSMKSVILFLALVAISLSQDDENKRNPALEAVGTAAVGAGILGGLLFGGAVAAGVVGDLAKAADSSRSNGGNIGRHHHVAHISNSGGIGTSSKVCDYQCKPNGGCTATYVGPSRPGKHSGSCFPDDFGGGCSGTPNECQNCNQVLSCSPEEIQKSAFDTRHTGGR